MILTDNLTVFFEGNRLTHIKFEIENRCLRVDFELDEDANSIDFYLESPTSTTYEKIENYFKLTDIMELPFNQIESPYAFFKLTNEKGKFYAALLCLTAYLYEKDIYEFIHKKEILVDSRGLFNSLMAGLGITDSRLYVARIRDIKTVETVSASSATSTTESYAFNIDKNVLWIS